jgi:acetyltransferase-like isoleucine patch superfamily enzyme
MHRAVKTAARLAAFILIAPRIAAYRCWSLILGTDRALESSTQAIARIPGIRGQYLRRAFLVGAGVRCHASTTICFGSILSKHGAILDENVYVGPNCHLGLVHLERDVLLAAGVHVPSGAHIHGTDDPTRPIREQEGRLTRVCIGAGSWVGSGAVVLANVGRNSIVGAGSVVTTPVPDAVIAAGVPARVIKERGASPTRV